MNTYLSTLKNVQAICNLQSANCKTVIDFLYLLRLSSVFNKNTI